MTSRRTFLEAAAGVSGLSVQPSPRSRAALGQLSEAQLPVALQTLTRAEMSELSGLAVGSVVALGERGREGLFVLRQGRIPSDQLQGLSIPASDAGCYWQRSWDGIHGRPEWFGAITGRADAAAANRAALQACIDLCPTTLLGGGDYYVDRALNITKNGTAILGTGHTQTDQRGNDAQRTSRIVSTSPRETILNVGVDSKAKPRDLTETVHLKGFTVDRSAQPFTPPAGFDGCIGIALRWCVNCHLDRLMSLNSARGFFYYGVVETYTRFCSALRSLNGSNEANDCFIGFHLDYNAPSGYNGGNASVYFIYCRTFPLTEGAVPSLSYSAGMRFDGGWVDCSIHGFESGAGIQYGIHGIGDGFDSETFRTENLIVTNCLLDGNATAGISLEQAGTRAAVVISNCYISTSQGTCIFLGKISGAVSVSGCQHITGQFGATGLSANEVTGLRSQGNIYTLLRQPIFLYKVSGFHIGDTVHGHTSNGDYPAVGLSACVHGKIDCIIRGPAGCYTAGVRFNDTGSRAVEVCGTGIDSAAFGGRTRAVVHAGQSVSTTGSFGTNCLLSGILA
jgi:hypothetical protein